MDSASPAPAEQPSQSSAATAAGSGDAASVFPDADPAENVDVFISHAGEQKRKVVDVIRTRLVERHPQLNVFVDEWSLKGGDKALHSIAAACRGAKVAVVVLSKQFVRKVHPMAELRILLQRLDDLEQCAKRPAKRRAEDKQPPRNPPSPQLWLVPVLYKLNVEDMWGMRALYDSQPWCGGEPKPDPAVLEAWAADLQAVARLTMIRPDQCPAYTDLAGVVEERVVELLDAAGHLPTAPPLCMEVRNRVTPPEPVQLVGREQELQQAFQALTDPAVRYVEVVAGPGEGKTSLVQRLVKRVCDEWRQRPVPEQGSKVAYALEVDLSLDGLTAAGVRRQAEAQNFVAGNLLAKVDDQVDKATDKEQWQALVNWLDRQAPAPVLVLFENAEGCVALPGEDPLRQAVLSVLEWLSRLEHVHLVVASRVRPTLERVVPTSSVVVLRQLSLDDGLQLLDNRLEPEHRPTDGNEHEAAKQLVELVQSNPLTLTVAARLVSRSRQRWQGILACAQDGISKIESKSRRGPGGMAKYMAALQAWLLNYLDETEKQLLGRVTLFAGSFSTPGAEAVSHGVPVDTDDIADLLVDLVDMSLLRQSFVSIDSNRSIERYSMHALVREAASSAFAPGDQVVQHFANWMLLDHEGPGQVLLRCEPEGAKPDTMLCLYVLREELLNIDAAGGKLEKAIDEDNGREMISAAGNIGWVLGRCGHSHAAEQLHQSAGNRAEKLWGPNDPQTLSTKNNLAVTRFNMGRLAGGSLLLNEVADGYTRLLGGEHPETLNCKNNLANILTNVREKQRLHNEVLQARKRVLGEDHPSTLGSQENLASALHDLGDVEEARKIRTRVLEVLTRVLGAEHPRTLMSKNNLANSLSAVQEWKKAAQLRQELLNTATRVLGPQHPDTLSYMTGLAAELDGVGQVQQALPLHKEAVKGYTQVLGPEHPETLVAQNNLASSLCHMSDFTGARRVWEEAAKGFTRALGPSDANTLSCKNNLYILLWNTGDREAARQLASEILPYYLAIGLHTV